MAIFTVASRLSLGQQSSPVPSPAVPPDKRIFWIIPNYRTSPSLHPYKPLSSREKFKLATKDSFDPGTVALAALFAGRRQLVNATPMFGQGAAGYARYLGAAYTDSVIGDMMTEGFFPVMFHQDPRYFRRGTGNPWSRLANAAGQIFWTHADSGATQFNFSEIAGNSTAVAISMAYYPNSRMATSAASKLGVHIGVHAASNVLKEFWPDIDRKLSKHDKGPVARSQLQ